MRPPAAAKARPRSHCVGPPSAAYAAQAEGVARMRSTPSALRVEVAGRKSSGEASVTLSAGGNAISDEVRTVAFAVAFVAVQGSVTLGAGRGAAASWQLPAVLAVTFAPQHVHARHPEMERTEEEQQQSERHRLVPQSKLLAQASPGEPSWHAPVNGAHAEQPALRAFAEQQKPPRQACEAQLELSVQAAPEEK